MVSTILIFISNQLKYSLFARIVETNFIRWVVFVKLKMHNFGRIKRSNSNAEFPMRRTIHLNRTGNGKLCTKVFHSNHAFMRCLRLVPWNMQFSNINIRFEWTRSSWLEFSLPRWNLQIIILQLSTIERWTIFYKICSAMNTDMNDERWTIKPSHNKIKQTKYVSSGFIWM